MVIHFRTRLLRMTSTSTRLNRQHITSIKASTTDNATSDNATNKKHKERVHWGQQPQNAFTDLGITTELYQKAGGARFRQHVNPLKKELQIPTDPLDWNQAYEDPSKPIIVDVGCGYGRFLLALLKNNSDYNGLGLEIRQPVIERANKWSETLNLNTRVQFVRANATISFSHTLSTYPGPIDLVTIQYPDPMFKARHKKRRVVQKHLVEAIAKALKPGARVLLQTDVLEVAEDMRDHFEKTAGDVFELSHEHSDKSNVFYESTPPKETDSNTTDNDTTSDNTNDNTNDEWVSEWATGGWLLKNPLPVPTEREVYVLSQDLPVYRMMLVKK